MHIGFLCDEYPPARHGGIGSFTQTLARALVRRGHQVTAIGLYPDERAQEEDDQGVRVVRLPQGRIPGCRIVSNGSKLRHALARIHRRHPMDVLEGAERAFFLVSARFEVPKIIRMHGGYTYFKVALGETPGRWMQWQERRSFHVANHVCAVSRYVAETTRRLLDLGDREIRVILNPVDLRMFRPAEPDQEVDGRIVYVGTVIEKKGIRQLVEAMPQIVAGYPQAHLHIYGNDSLDLRTGGSYTAALRGGIPAELSGRIVFEGSVSRQSLPGLLARAAVCVYPSHMEALPIAWIEGLAMGKAVAASRTGPGPEVLEDNVSGLLCDPHTPDSIAQTVLRLLRDPALRRRLGQSARDRAERLFSLDRLVEENLEYYEACARASKAQRTVMAGSGRQ